MSDRSFNEAEIRKILRDSELGIGVAEVCQKHGIEEETFRQWKEQYGSHDGECERQKLEEENRNLKQIVADLMLEKRALLQHRVSLKELQGTDDYCGLTDSAQDAANVSPAVQGSLRVDGKPDAGQNVVDPQGGARVEAGTGRVSEMYQSVRSLLERSRIIPAIRSSEFIPAAVASPALVVSLLYGSPLTIGDVVKRLRSAGKLPIANLDLLTGFAQDSDAVSLLVKLGVAGIVSTRQSALRAAHAQGIIAVQRTFAVDSIALHNITRALHHFVPHAIELLPAVAAPLAMPSLNSAKPSLPVIATGLVNSLRQVEELVSHGITSVATSNSSLWIL